jgi:hypothetical protein
MDPAGSALLVHHPMAAQASNTAEAKGRPLSDAAEDQLASPFRAADRRHPASQAPRSGVDDIHRDSPCWRIPPKMHLLRCLILVTFHML